MTSINISLPESMRDYIDQQVQGGAYSTASEFVRQLIREDQKREAEQRLQVALLDGLDSGEPIEITNEWWDRKRAELTARLNGGRTSENSSKSTR